MSRQSYLLFALALCTAASNSFAKVIYWEDNDVGTPLDFLHEKWGSNDTDYDQDYINTWNILSAGYDPSKNTIDGIEVTFAFADDKPGSYEGAEIGNGGDIEEYVDIFLGSNAKRTQVADDREVDGRHPYDTYQFFSLTLDPTTHSNIFSQLTTTGKLKYEIKLAPIFDDNASSDSGYKGDYLEDTYFKVAKIRAYQHIPDDPPVGVPDQGSTLLCLSASIAGLLGLRKKFATQA